MSAVTHPQDASQASERPSRARSHILAGRRMWSNRTSWQAGEAEGGVQVRSGHPEQRRGAVPRRRGGGAHAAGGWRHRAYRGQPGRSRLVPGHRHRSGALRAAGSAGQQGHSQRVRGAAWNKHRARWSVSVNLRAARVSFAALSVPSWPKTVSGFTGAGRRSERQRARKDSGGDDLREGADTDHRGAVRRLWRRRHCGQVPDACRDRHQQERHPARHLDL